MPTDEQRARQRARGEQPSQREQQRRQAEAQAAQIEAQQAREDLVEQVAEEYDISKDEVVLDESGDQVEARPIPEREIEIIQDELGTEYIMSDPDIMNPIWGLTRPDRMDDIRAITQSGGSINSHPTESLMEIDPAEWEEEVNDLDTSRHLPDRDEIEQAQNLLEQQQQRIEDNPELALAEIRESDYHIDSTIQAEGQWIQNVRQTSRENRARRDIADDLGVSVDDIETETESGRLNVTGISDSGREQIQQRVAQEGFDDMIDPGAVDVSVDSGSIQTDVDTNIARDAAIDRQRQQIADETGVERSDVELEGNYEDYSYDDLDEEELDFIFSEEVREEQALEDLRESLDDPTRVPQDEDPREDPLYGVDPEDVEGIDLRDDGQAQIQFTEEYQEEQARIDLAKQYSQEQPGTVDPEDIQNVDVSGEEVDYDLSGEVDRELREQSVADEYGIDTSEVTATDSGVEIDPETQVDLFGDEMAAEAADELGVDEEDVEIDIEDGQPVARAVDQEEQFWDDPIGSIGDFAGNASSTVLSVPLGAMWAASNPGEAVEGARDFGEDVVEGISNFGSDVSDEVDSETVATGAAITAVPEPTPVTETAGALIVGGALAGSAGRVIADRNGDQGTSEIDVPEETTVGAPEIGIPEDTNLQIPELSVSGQTTAELPVPAERSLGPEVSIPTDTGSASPLTINTQQLVAQEQLRRQREDDILGGAVITEEDIYDPEELRREELREFQEQYEEQQLYRRRESEVDFTESREPVWTVDQTETLEGAELTQQEIEVPEWQETELPLQQSQEPIFSPVDTESQRDGIEDWFEVYPETDVGLTPDTTTATQTAIEAAGLLEATTALTTDVMADPVVEQYPQEYTTEFDTLYETQRSPQPSRGGPRVPFPEWDTEDTGGDIFGLETDEAAWETGIAEAEDLGFDFDSEYDDGDFWGSDADDDGWWS